MQLIYRQFEYGGLLNWGLDWPVGPWNVGKWKRECASSDFGEKLHRIRSSGPSTSHTAIFDTGEITAPARAAIPAKIHPG